MPLVDLKEVAELLVCPRCRSALTPDGDAMRCASPGCALHAPGSFPLAGEQPVLVDFDRSVLRREALGRTPEVPVPLSERLPPLLRRMWKPPNRVAERNIGRLLAMLSGPAPLLLVVGGATVGNGAGAVYTDPRVRVLGFDITGSPQTCLLADAHQIPLADGSVDAVLVQAVLEHVLDPAQVVSEIHRVLKEGGAVYAETPFLQQVHAGAYDFVRFTASGHRYLFRWFEEVDAGVVAGPGTQLLWTADHVVRGLTRSVTAGRVARALLCWLCLLDGLVPARYASDGASACYFLGRRREASMTPAEIIRYYPGAQAPG